MTIVVTCSMTSLGLLAEHSFARRFCRECGCLLQYILSGRYHARPFDHWRDMTRFQWRFAVQYGSLVSPLERKCIQSSRFVVLNPALRLENVTSSTMKRDCAKYHDGGRLLLFMSHGLESAIRRRNVSRRGKQWDSVRSS